MAVPQFRSVGTKGEGTGAVTPGLPSDYQADDILILIVESAAEAGSAPTGYAAVTGSPQSVGVAAATNAVAIEVYWKRAVASETAPSVADRGQHTMAILLAFSGCIKTGNPYETGSGGTQATSLSTTLTALGITTTFADSLIVVAANHGIDNGGAAWSSWANASLTNLTQRYNDSTAQGTGGGIGVVTGEKATAGATGTTTATLSASREKAWVTFSLKPEWTPTIALNTADATDFGSDTTPTVEFTGTDNNGDDLRYNTQIDTVNTFDSNTTIVATETGTSVSNGVFTITGGSTGSNTNAQGQSFTPSSTIVLTKIDIHVGAITGSPTDGLQITVRTGSITGTVVATSDLLASASISAGINTVLFSDGVTLASGTTYYMQILRGSDGTTDVNNYYRLSGTTTGTNGYYRFTGSWTGSQANRFHKVYTSAALLDKTSGTDSGFVNTVNGADTDPFTSGQKVSYTVQAGDALAGGTYYWRARAKDPSGSNTYSDWPTARTFTISTVAAVPNKIVHVAQSVNRGSNY